MKEEPTRIAQIVGKWVGGGVEAVLMNYYTHIDRSKIQFDFICDSDSTDIPYEKIESLGGRVILIPPYQKIFKYQKELKKVLKEGNYKIVHSHINALSVFPLFSAKRAGVPVRIAHSHSTSNKKEWKKTIIKNILRPFSRLFATDYMACTKHAGDWLFGSKANVYILNNAIDFNRFKYDENIRENKRKELNIPKDLKVIGHVGRFVGQKNHDFLIDVFNEIHKQDKDTMLLLIGQGPLIEKIQEKVKELGIENSVIFLGQRSDISELYQALDLFLFPSIYEGLGMVLVEAQCSGLKCISSTEVPLVAKVASNLIDFIDLKLGAQEWACKAVDSLKKETDRIINKKDFEEKGYDIDLESKKLVERYKSLIKNIN